MYVKNNSFCELDHFMIWLYAAGSYPDIRQKITLKLRQCFIQDTLGRRNSSLP